MKSMILFVFVLIVALAAEAEAQNAASPIDNFIQGKMNESGMAGMAAAIVENDKVVWSRGYGYADLDNKIPFTSNTIMNVGGISKTVTAFCVMRAVQDGLLELDQDINHYLPFKVSNPFFPNEKITLHHLMTNTSGIVDRSEFYDSTYFYGGDSPIDLGEFEKDYLTPDGKYYSEDNFVKSKPGAFHRYSNIASGLVAYIVEVVSGRPFNVYSKEVCFNPLGMDSTGWFLTEINQNKHSKLYDKEGDSLKSVVPYGLVTYPDGGMRTSVADLSKFLICLMNAGKYNEKTILKKALAQEIVRPQLSASVDSTSINITNLNIGFYTYIRSQTGITGSNGHDPGIRTRMWYDPVKQMGVILLTNTSFSGKDYSTYFMAINNELWKYPWSLMRP